MVSYILIIQNGPILTYEYYPNGEKDLKGSFSINRDTKEIFDIHLSRWEYWDEEKQDGNRKEALALRWEDVDLMKKNKMEIESIL